MTNNVLDKNNCVSSPLKNVILDAVSAIKKNDNDLAKNLLKQAVLMDLENPIIYNLLGIMYENEGDRQKASKFYRVAYYMDPTFIPSSDNLERISNIFSVCFVNVNWGLDRLGGEE